MKGPLEIDGQAQDLDWLGDFGTLTVLDGSPSITAKIRIPEFASLLEPQTPKRATSTDPKYRVLLGKLRSEIDRILDAQGPLAPMRHTNYDQAPGAGNYRVFYWGNPGEFVLTMCRALPFLEEDKAKALKQAIRTEVERYDPLRISRKSEEGARRETFLFDPGVARVTQADARPNLNNLYALWVYAERAAPDGTTTSLWPRVQHFAKSILEGKSEGDPGYVWDAGENPALQPHAIGPKPITNARLNFYLGYARFAKANGDTDAERLATALFARGLLVKLSHAYYQQYLIEKNLEHGISIHYPEGAFSSDRRIRSQNLASIKITERDLALSFGSSLYGKRESYSFLMDLSPEIATFLGHHAKGPIESCVNWHCHEFPAHWLGRGGQVFPLAEYNIVEPWISHATAMAQIDILGVPPEEAIRYVGHSTATFGDLYYIQKLCAALRSFEVRENMGAR